jgi:hypothetical protein
LKCTRSAACFKLWFLKAKFVKTNLMASVTEQQWNSYFMQLNDVEKKSVLLMLRAFLRERSEENRQTSIEQYNKEIDEAVAEMEAGNYISQEEMEKLAAKW